MEKSLEQQKSPVLPIFNITKEGFLELQKAGLTLDQLFYLESIKYQLNLKDIISRDKYLSWRQSLIRKALITEDGKLTEDGGLVLVAVGSGEPFRGSLERKHEASEAAFEDWWRVYPASDIFAHKGRKFDGARAFKRDKPQCKDLFVKIVNEEGYTAEDLIRALEFEVLLKKEASVKSGLNEMKYMTNTHSYLNQRKFEGFMEASKMAQDTPLQTGEDI